MIRTIVRLMLPQHKLGSMRKWRADNRHPPIDRGLGVKAAPLPTQWESPTCIMARNGQTKMNNPQNGGEEQRQKARKSDLLTSESSEFMVANHLRISSTSRSCKQQWGSEAVKSVVRTFNIMGEVSVRIASHLYSRCGFSSSHTQPMITLVWNPAPSVAFGHLSPSARQTARRAYISKLGNSTDAPGVG